MVRDLRPQEALHLGPGGPAQTAGEWFRAIVDRSDLPGAWTLTAPQLRLALVQSWLMITDGYLAIDRDELANALASGPAAEEWTEFAAWRVGRWRTGVFRPFVLDGWGLVSTPEIVGPDTEFVRIAPGRQEREFVAGESLVVQTLTVRLIDRTWLVAGVGRTLAVPGWPPSEESLPTDYGRPFK